MKRILFTAVVLLVLLGTFGCASLMERTTVFPDEYIPVQIDGVEGYCKALVKVEF